MKTRALPPSITDALKLHDPAAEVAAVADYLRHLLKDMHGGEWRLQIDHEHQFVLLARRSLA